MKRAPLPDLTSPGEDLYAAWRAEIGELVPEEARTMPARIAHECHLKFVHDCATPWRELPLQMRSFYQAVAARFLSED